MTDATPRPAADATPRPARPEDVPAVLALVRELAVYEREPDAVQTTEEQLHTALFGEAPTVFAHVVEHPGADGPEVVGFALWYLSFSTWVGSNGIYLEDLYVRPEHRGRGYGRALLRELARLCTERGYGRFEWWVLQWNTPARDFYAAHGARPMDEWVTYRVDGAGLASLAGS